jgi:branched-chain amino acid transport system ATP-binding protein
MAAGGLTPGPIIEVEGLTKEFSGFVAVRHVTLQIMEGSIHALIGPNGAGKTTLFNLISKFLEPTAGRIFYQGRDVTRVHPVTLSRQGMCRSFQISAVFPHFTVLENVRLALQRKLGTSFHFWKSGHTLDVLNDRARELLNSVGLIGSADRQTSELPYGHKRAVELATTLALDPKVMLLDEPTAGLGREDVATITGLIRKAAKSRTVVMVEHNLPVVADLSDLITVLERGEVMAEGSYEEIAKNPDVRRAYLGAEDA